MAFTPNNKPTKEENRNLTTAIIFSLIILVGFHFFYEKPRLDRLKAEQALQAEIKAQNETAEITIDTTTKTIEKALPKVSPKIMVKTPSLNGSIDLIGARINNLSLNNYAVSLEDDSPVQLLASSKTKHPYYGEFGWLGSNVKTPNAKTLWSLSKDSAKELTPTTPITLNWNNGEGLIFSKKISVDENYLFTISQHVVNNSSKTITLYPYGLISRHNIPEDYAALFILHEGPVGYIDGSLKEHSYDDLADDGEISFKDKGGWLGFTDKYWLTALLPNSEETYQLRYAYTGTNQDDRYQTDYKGAAVTLAPNTQETHNVHFFAGAKKLDLLDAYEKETGVQHLDLAIDFGWFYFMTKPFFYLLNFLFDLVGNFGVAIICFTIILRLGLFPFASKTFRSMARLKEIAPQMTALKERYANDRIKLQEEIMKLYQKEKVSPFSGCAPILIQIPIFFALYKVLYVTIEMRHTPFFGWIQDLSQPDPTSVFNLFGLLPFEPFSFLMIGGWPLLMCLTLILQQLLNPKPQDPVQAKIMAFFPFIMTFILAGFPAGLVVYWTFSNIFSIAQQAYIMKSMNISILRRYKDDENKK